MPALRRVAFDRQSSLSLALGVCLAWSSACQGPPALAGAPWSSHRAGRVGVGGRLGLGSLYGIQGHFTADTPAAGQLEEDDSGDVIGRFGLATRAGVLVTDRIELAAGLDFRIYDVEDLNPIDELPVLAETIESLQYFAAARYLFDPLPGRARWRPYGELSVSYLPEVDIAFEVDLSRFDSSNLQIDSTGEPYWVLGLGGGVLYQWSEHWILEAGLAYELPLSTLDADLSLEVADTVIPFATELEPSGLIGFIGASYYW